MTTVFTNGRVYAPTNGDEFVSAFVVTDEYITHVGQSDDDEVRHAVSNGGNVVDLDGTIVVPGFIDAHVHLLQFGLALRKLNVQSCQSLQSIRDAIAQYAKDNPQLSRILCRGWIPTLGEQPLAIHLDDLDEQNRPIFIEAGDFHSSWLNTSALDELDLDNRQIPSGGTVHRDENGRPSGLLSEEASLLISSPFIVQVAPINEKMLAIHEAVTAYISTGVTGVVDMAMDESTWDALCHYRQEYGFPFHIAMHWLIPHSEDKKKNFTHVNRAIELQEQGYHPSTSPDFCIAGIKILSDGVIDTCTAALKQPYTNETRLVPTIWSANALNEVVEYADSVGVQVAIHAIGDQAVHQAINAVEAGGTPGRRHRIEHLELTSPEDAKRLGELGITASVQPVHSDPVWSTKWPDIIGEDRHKRTFAYKDFLDGGARLAFGTDVPTAPHLTLPNMYISMTRRSAFDPSSPLMNNPHFALPLAAAVTAATSGAAEARFAEKWTGSLKRGLRADFVLLDMEWNKEDFIKGKVLETWSRGKMVYKV
ncbi:hypothetical protein ASPWEDRAFT_589679 [Aspergillus wentii DTO 134E9]|uniref:Amidohydrolase 3 domain-containing protein n=1 Tax=Aspergillus wentii DTO 134E9 TaxID=1073089 RepID=A0A1L9RCR1_ASPWE|nr:uncharacterized protein ASPWEDRAFT_589679 [Aspergillus wentii DTO 134E9]OJJ32710.1 hypothetical protein ASPWEDRAFT_589679 [Aspergillus wentii DTO 134E9]